MHSLLRLQHCLLQPGVVTLCLHCLGEGWCATEPLGGLLLPRPATCSWHCLYDTRAGSSFCCIKSRENAAPLSGVHTAPPPRCCCRWGAGSLASLRLGTGWSQLLRSALSHVVYLSSPLSTTHDIGRRLGWQECPCSQQGELRSPSQTFLATPLALRRCLQAADSNHRLHTAALHFPLHSPPGGCEPPLGFLSFQG